MLNQQHQPINLIQKIGDATFSILAQALQISVYGGQIGAVVGLFLGAILWLFFKQNTNFGMFEGAIIGMVFIGLIGLIVGGLIGMMNGTLNIYHNGQLYELYIYLMVWLGASPPSDFKLPQTDVTIRVGLDRVILRICFWISFWAIIGAIVGAMGGLVFGLFGFVVGSISETFVLMGLWSMFWGMLGALYGVIIGTSLWLTSQVMKKVKNGSRQAELLYWLVGGKIGERIFNRLFGERVV